MANLAITVGPVTASLSVGDAVAQEILSDYADAYDLDATGTAQERLDAVVRHLARHVQEVANGYQQRAGAAAERERLREELEARQWSDAEPEV